MMSTKQIIVIVGVILLAFVIYQGISSSGQERKEKSVLKERFILEQTARQPLEQCLNEAEEWYENQVEYYRDPSFMEVCVKSESSKSPNPQKSCFDGLLSFINKDLKPEKEGKINDCYRRYK